MIGERNSKKCTTNFGWGDRVKFYIYIKVEKTKFEKRPRKVKMRLREAPKFEWRPRKTPTFSSVEKDQVLKEAVQGQILSDISKGPKFENGHI